MINIYIQFQLDLTFIFFKDATVNNYGYLNNFSVRKAYLSRTPKAETAKDKVDGCSELIDHFPNYTFYFGSESHPFSF